MRNLKKSQKYSHNFNNFKQKILKLLINTINMTNKFLQDFIGIKKDEKDKIKR